MKKGKNHPNPAASKKRGCSSSDGERFKAKVQQWEKTALLIVEDASATYLSELNIAAPI